MAKYCPSIRLNFILLYRSRYSLRIRDRLMSNMKYFFVSEGLAASAFIILTFRRAERQLHLPLYATPPV